MDAPWYALTEAEEESMGGLSEDLYALAENNPRSVPMAADGRGHWGQAFKAALDVEDRDRALVLLRRPPADVPVEYVAFFQADCWKHLGCPEATLRFMRAATRLDPAQAASVLTLWFPREVG